MEEISFMCANEFVMLLFYEKDHFFTDIQPMMARSGGFSVFTSFNSRWTKASSTQTLFELSKNKYIKVAWLAVREDEELNKKVSSSATALMIELQPSSWSAPSATARQARGEVKWCLITSECSVYISHHLFFFCHYLVRIGMSNQIFATTERDNN